MVRLTDRYVCRQVGGWGWVVDRETLGGSRGGYVGRKIDRQAHR